MASLKALVSIGFISGIALVVLFSIVPVPEYPVFPDFYPRQQDADYTPPLKLEILDLRGSYMVGEAVDFAVRQTAGGGCVLPQLVMIKDLDDGRIVKLWNNTEIGVFGCPVETNPDALSMTWNNKDDLNPIFFNQTGSYAVVAKHMSKTVQKEFQVVAIGDDGRDTSPDVAASLLSHASDLDTVRALLKKYPNANTTVTANYRSELFEEFQKYHPAGIVQYHVARTESPASTEDGRARSLTVTVMFDRQYEYNSVPLVLVHCMGENYSSLSAGEPYVEPSKIDDC